MFIYKYEDSVRMLSAIKMKTSSAKITSQIPFTTIEALSSLIPEKGYE